MKPDNIFLVRHGQSEGNVDRSVYLKTPDYAVKLTETGKSQARRAGEQLFKLLNSNSIHCYVSPYHRTRQTYVEIKKALELRGVKVTHREDARLREQEWAGSLRKEEIDFKALEAERDAYGHHYYRFHGGESCADVGDRSRSIMNTMFRDFEKEDFPSNFLIVGHGMFNRVFFMCFFNLTVEEFELLANPKNGEIIHLQLDKETKKYKCVTEMRRYEKPFHTYQLPI